MVAADDDHGERAEIGACNADFFDDKNEQTSALRERVAATAMKDMLKWLDNPENNNNNSNNNNNNNNEHQLPDETDSASVMSRRPSEATTTAARVLAISERSHDRNRIAIFDATNSTNKRRRWILEECTSPIKRQGKTTGVVFVESLCDDEELLRENYKYKVSSSPDFKGMSEEEALADLGNRVQKYEDRYETITDPNQSYIKIYNLSTKLMVNHIYGRMAKTIVPCLMAWNVGTRPIFLCRPGRTPHNIPTDSEDYVSELDLSGHGSNNMKKMKGEKLGREGLMFRDALASFVVEEGREFMRRRNQVAFTQSLNTGTSRSGLVTFQDETDRAGEEHEAPLTVMTSTMPRAVETVIWGDQQVEIDAMSNLNPLDKGDFAGLELEEIQSQDPAWYARLEQEPFLTR